MKIQRMQATKECAIHFDFCALFKSEESFNNRGDFTESYAVNLLSNVDFLFFDDLGEREQYEWEPQRNK